MATVGPTNLPAYFDSDAVFRTWGSTISAALATLGLIKTSDTGQINWTTVTHPVSGSSVAGYEIWRFADSLQATTPVFIKLEYGTGAAADRPSMWVTVGSGSDGSGVLTGQLSTRFAVAASGGKSAGINLLAYVSGSTGELMCAFNVDTAATTFGCFFAVERTKDAADTPTADGVLISTVTSASSNSYFVPPSGSVPPAQSWAAIPPGLWARSSSGANAGACPVLIPILANWLYSRLLITADGDFTAGGTFTATVLGGSHTYMAFNRACGTIFYGSINSGFAMRWE